MLFSQSCFIISLSSILPLPSASPSALGHNPSPGTQTPVPYSTASPPSSLQAVLMQTSPNHPFPLCHCNKRPSLVKFVLSVTGLFVSNETHILFYNGETVTSILSQVTQRRNGVFYCHGSQADTTFLLPLIYVCNSSFSHKRCWYCERPNHTEIKQQANAVQIMLHEEKITIQYRKLPSIAGVFARLLSLLLKTSF